MNDKKQGGLSGNSLLRRKLFLYLTEFFSGVSVMAAEFGAGRLSGRTRLTEPGIKKSAKWSEEKRLEMQLFITGHVGSNPTLSAFSRDPLRWARG